jgi:hypothetical protein
MALSWRFLPTGALGASCPLLVPGWEEIHGAQTSLPSDLFLPPQ